MEVISAMKNTPRPVQQLFTALEEVYHRAEMVVKFPPLVKKETSLASGDQILFSFLHFASWYEKFIENCFKKMLLQLVMN